MLVIGFGRKVGKKTKLIQFVLHEITKIMELRINFASLRSKIMETKNEKVPLGRIVFLAGILLSIVSGWFEIKPLPLILSFLGLFVGILNVREKETASFLIATMALTVVGMASLQAITLPEILIGGLGTAGILETVTAILRNFTAFVSAAAFIVALREVFTAVKPS